jgi:adenosylmethionine-8-amino-7-oxononanoate aminotransferase
MNDLVILGTDTDAGKTTFALLWLAQFGEFDSYWKPLESGDSDSQKIQRLLPGVRVHSPVRHFDEPVAPMLAARRLGQSIPSAEAIAAARPNLEVGGLVIETFGSPFSPLNEAELQIELIRRYEALSVLVSSSAVGAIGRTLQCLRALRDESIEPAVIALLGSVDPFAEDQIARYSSLPVVSLTPPVKWDEAGIQESAKQQQDQLKRVAKELAEVAPGSARDSSTPNLSPRLRELRYGHETSFPSFSDLLTNDRQLIWHPYTSLHEPDLPLPVISAKDEFLLLADGRQVIDGISSWWTILHGHCHPSLVSALSEAARSIDHVHFAGVTHPWAVELAELLLVSAPWQDGRVFYSDNGSTSVEVALKMAYQFWQHRDEPQRALFIGFENGYHGDTFGAMSVGRDPLFFGRFEPLLFRAEIIPLEADRLAETLKRNRGKVAAVIIEPLVQGAGGMRMHSPEELRAIFDATREHDVLFIADEVMTGCRLGSRWAHQIAGIAPDLICASKTLTGGMMPLAATLASPRIVGAWETDDRRRTFFHGHSFTAHPLACAVAIANCRLLGNEKNPRVRRIEAFWRSALETLRENPKVKDLRICGSIAAVELAVDGGYLAEIGRELRRSCLEAGVLLRPLGNVLYSMPPLNTSDQSLHRIAKAMMQSVDLVRL